LLYYWSFNCYIIPITHPMITNIFFRTVLCVLNICKKFHLDWMKIAFTISFQSLVIKFHCIVIDSNLVVLLLYHPNPSSDSHKKFFLDSPTCPQYVYKISASLHKNYSYYQHIRLLQTDVNMGAVQKQYNLKWNGTASVPPQIRPCL